MTDMEVINHEIAEAEEHYSMSITEATVQVIDHIIKRVHPTLRYKAFKRIVRIRQAAGVPSAYYDWVKAYPNN